MTKITIKPTMTSTTETTVTTTLKSSNPYTNIAPGLDHCFFDGYWCSQWDYENQINIEEVKG
jgi:hypothetical protein